jgi:hypothetical protein
MSSMAQSQTPHLPDAAQLARLLAWRGAWISMINTRVAAGQKRSHRAAVRGRLCCLLPVRAARHPQAGETAVS